MNNLAQNQSRPLYHTLFPRAVMKLLCNAKRWH
jgi:hypothetical protein